MQSDVQPAEEAQGRPETAPQPAPSAGSRRERRRRARAEAAGQHDFHPEAHDPENDQHPHVDEPAAQPVHHEQPEPAAKSEPPVLSDPPVLKKAPELEPAIPLKAATPPRQAAAEIDVRELQNELKSKETLIVALTDRLELAAEQLDRLRRSGATMHRGASGGLPPELLDDHRATIDDLKQSIVRWEAMQCGPALGRMEMQLVELRDLVASLSHGGFTATTGGFAADPTHPHLAPAHTGPTRLTLSHAEPEAGRGGTGGAWWEATKAALLSGDAPPPHSETSDASPSETRSFHDDGLPALPEPVDFDQLTLESACHLLRERDDLISHLHEQLLIRQAAEEFPADQASLEQLPPPLRERLAVLEAKWQAKFRQAELDLSLERARLSRTSATLAQQQHQQHQVDQGTARDAALQREGTGNETKSAKRWFKFLGKNES